MASVACDYGQEPSDATTPTISQGPSVQATIKTFTLPNLAVVVGTTVTWPNEDGAPHTTTSGQNGRFDDIGWNSSSLSRGESFSYTFNEVGTFNYTCGIHPSLSGTVTVVDGSGQSTEIPSDSSSEGDESGGDDVPY